MAEHANVEVIRRAYQAFADGDLATLRGLWTEDIIFHIKGLADLDGDYRGPDAVFAFMGRLAEETGGTYRQDVHSILANDEHSATMLTVHAERNGASRSSDLVHLSHMREGKTAELWVAYIDPVNDVAFWR
jgi:ketosteroid isomerase-like protein